MDAASVYEDVNNSSSSATTSAASNKPEAPPQKPNDHAYSLLSVPANGNDCVTIISVSPASLPMSHPNAQSVNAPANGAHSPHLSSPSPIPSASEGGGATTTIGSETSSDRGSFTINSITRTHGSKCSCKRSTKGNNNIKEEPTYENLEFHRVKISIPGTNKHMLLHNHYASGMKSGASVSSPGVNLVNSRIVRRSRVNKTTNRSSRPMTLATAPSAIDVHQQSHQQQGQTLTAAQEQKKKFEKFGYSQNEVWNWLYTEEEDEEEEEQGEGVSEQGSGATETATVIPDRLRDLYSVPQKLTKRGGEERVSIRVKNGGEHSIIHPQRSSNPEPQNKTVEVKFTPHEFINASSRLEHLNLDGLEHFVGNTLEKAIAKKQKQRNEEIRRQRRQNEVEQNTVTITEVPQSSPLDVRTNHHQQPHKCGEEVNNNNNNNSNSTNNNNDSKHQQQHQQHSRLNSCQTCLASGESSCSSALSSLESVRSSNSSASQGHRSSSGSETLGSELVHSGGRKLTVMPTSSSQQQSAVPSASPAKPARQPGQPMTKQEIQMRREALSEKWMKRMSANYDTPADPTSGSSSSCYQQLSSSSKPYQTLEIQGDYLDNHNGE